MKLNTLKTSIVAVGLGPSAALTPTSRAQESLPSPATVSACTSWKQLLAFLKATLLGGVLFVLPAWLAVLLVAKALMHLQVFVKPVSSHLPQDINHPRVLAIVLLVAMCFLVGLVIQTTIGAQAKRIAEQRVLDKVPGYTTLRGVAEQMGDLEEEHGFKPALIEIEEALAPGFIVEEHDDGKCTVFVPSSPTPMAGTIYIIDRARVHPVNVPVTKMFKCISKWGAGAGELLAAMHRETPGKKSVSDTTFTG